MRQNIVLIVFGSLMGLMVLGLVYPIFQSFKHKLPAGARFESVEDFHTTLLQRDERDLHADESVSLRSLITPHNAERIMYDLIPGQQVKFQGVPVRVNSCGMRGPEISVEKSSGVYRIALLGDSFTFGWGVEEEKIFATVLQDRLNDFFQGAPEIEVLNFGVPGYSTFQEAAIFQERALEFEPDAVMVFFVENDFGLPFFINSMKVGGKLMSSTSFAKSSWAGQDQEIVDQNRRLMSFIDPNKALRDIANICREQGLPFFVAINPRPNWLEDKKKLWIVKKRKDIKLISLREEFMNIVEQYQIDPAELSLPDDPHPSALKHRILGELLASALLPSVAESYVKN